MKFIELTKEEFSKYLPFISFECAIASERLYDRRNTIPFAESLVEYWNKQLNGK